jgi:hypothetical protein
MAAPPANDDFANAQTLSGPLPISVSGTNAEATNEPGEPDHAGSPATASVWYSWTASTTEPIQIDTCGPPTDFDTVLAVYTGTAVDSLTEVASDDDSCGAASRVVFNATAGTTYKIAIDTFFGLTGNFALRVGQPPPPPANDDFANAQTLSGSLPIIVSGRT